MSSRLFIKLCILRNEVYHVLGVYCYRFCSACRHSHRSIDSSHLMSRHRRTETNKGGGRRWQNNKIYSSPLPITFSESTSIFSFFTPRLVHNPSCEGIFDPLTRSVWVTNSKDSTILWRRGFFGKGDLSRSEPSWLSRQINARKAALSGKSV